jgi:hypothetical protein
MGCIGVLDGGLIEPRSLNEDDEEVQPSSASSLTKPISEMTRFSKVTSI